jgi:hypothetical protein
MMKSRYSLGILAAACLLLGLNGGCLSLSLFNHDGVDANKRLDSVERRVSALEGANASPQNPPGVPMSSMSMPAPVPPPVGTQPVNPGHP